MEFDALRGTMFNLDPFDITPVYAFLNESNMGIIAVSELTYKEGFAPLSPAFNNLFLFKNNIEEYFKEELANSEEIENNGILTFLQVIVFNEEGENIMLLKGLNYMHPGRFFMIDLYSTGAGFTEKNAQEYITMFNTLTAVF